MANIYTAALMEHNAHPDYKYQMEEPKIGRAHV